MNILLLTALLSAQGYFHLPLHWTILAAWVWWSVFLVPNTWRDFLAGMTYYRLKRLGRGDWVAEPDPEQRCNEPDADRVVSIVLWLPGAAKNFVVAKLASAFYYFTWPRLQDVGLTKLTNRMADTGTPRQKAKAASVRRRWLDRYDPRGHHT
jgi:hypothetical protein